MKLSDITQLNVLLDTIKVKEFSLDDLEKLLKLKKATKTIVEQTTELKIEVMKKFEITAVNGRYEYQGHEKQTEIDKMINDINNNLYELKDIVLNFIIFDQLKAGLKEEHSLDNILILKDYLVKK